MNDDQSAEQPQKSAITVSRIILVLILVAAVGALVFDFMAKQKMNAAYAKIDDANNQAETTLKGLDQAAVQAEVGRAPDNETKQGTSVVIQQYDFQGVFYKHRLEVEYFGGAMRGFNQKSVFRFSGE